MYSVSLRGGPLVMGNFGANKDVEKIIRIARKQGWDVQMTKGNHIKFIPPNGDFIISGLSMRDSGVLQLKKRLKKAGLQY